MSIINELSSQKGDRTSTSNKKVAAKCINDKKLLKEISKHLHGNNTKLTADCAEVMNVVSAEHPELVTPYGIELIELIHHKNSKARWETMTCIAHITHLSPDLVESMLPELMIIIETDKSVIVRENAVESIAIFSGAGKRQAMLALPYLIKTLDIWGDKHASRALKGLLNAYKMTPSIKSKLIPIVENYINSSRGIIKQAAGRLYKALK